VNKKKQKNFVTWSVPASVGALQVAKVFCFFFSKKMLPSLTLPLPSTMPRAGAGRSVFPHRSRWRQGSRGTLGRATAYRRGGETPAAILAAEAGADAIVMLRQLLGR